jgi:hypothetical protein
VNNVTFATGAALGAVPVVFVVTMSVLVLLCVRAWCGVFGVVLTRQVIRLLNGSIGFLFVLFAVLVVIRFEAVG